MTIRQVLIYSTVTWLYTQYPDELPEAEIMPALRMCADMLNHTRDVRKANAYLNALYPGGRGERSLIADVMEAWKTKRAEDTRLLK